MTAPQGPACLTSAVMLVSYQMAHQATRRKINHIELTGPQSMALPLADCP